MIIQTIDRIKAFYGYFHNFMIFSVLLPTLYYSLKQQTTLLVCKKCTQYTQYILNILNTDDKQTTLTDMQTTVQNDKQTYMTYINVVVSMVILTRHMSDMFLLDDHDRGL